MKSFTNESQIPQTLLHARNDRLGVNQEAEKKAREHIKPDVDITNDEKFWSGEGLTLEFKRVEMTKKAA